METLLADVRHGCRLLMRNPAFTTIVLLALALGIGANTAVFSVMNAVLFKPLPYNNPDHIVSVAGRFTGIGIPDDRNAISPPEFLDLRRFPTAFSDISAMQATSYNIRVGDTPERISGATVSASFFRVFGTDAYLGRTFAVEEEQQGHDAVAVLGYALWQRVFQSDRNVIGRSMDISGRSYTIVGVMPGGFQVPPLAEMWTPLAFTDAQLSPNARGNHGLQVFARIKPELTLDQALADMERTSRQIIESAPQYPYANFNFTILIRPVLEDLVGAIRPALVLLMGAVALVLLIACSNVANLMMVRASAREREIGIRTALGASRTRLVCQLLTESAVLATVGAIVGIALARLGVAAIASRGGTAFPRLAQASLDGPTLIFTLAITLLTGLVFGIVPALQVSQAETHETLKEGGGRGSTVGSGHQRLRKLLVVGEIALSLALLSGAGLLIKSFVRLQEIDPGFSSSGVLTMRVVLPPARYAQPEQIRTFFGDLMRRVTDVPGIRSGGAVNGLPISGNGGSGTTTVDSTALPLDQSSPEADLRIVTPGYMETMGMQLVAGRYFDEHDNEMSAPVAIIDETMAKTYWPNGDALGKRLKRGGRQSTNPWMTIAGVVRHVRYLSLERPSRVQLYWPHAQNPLTAMSLALRTSGEPAAIAAAIQRATIAMDPDQPIFAVRPMDELLADSMMRRRLVMLLLAVFAGVAVTLAALGIYGVISYWVSQRAHEIGIRMALGATRGHVLRMVAGQSFSVLAVGVLLGLAGSLGLTRLMRTMLFNVDATDPSTFALVCGSLLGVGLLASVIPALRAILVDPVHTLRQE
ncbi:MAG TPA: ABC transporter permease [Terriglobia bacterium]|nr:ABC transporter permease [Terriglobia bacterium]